VAESKIGKGANRALMQNSGTAQNRSGALNAKSNSIYGTLDPALTAEATNPTGYAPNDLAATNTASQQSLGGSTAGITGQANLEAARTRNAGGFQGAIGSGSRSNAKQLSQNALGIQEQNAQLKEAQKQTALSQLQQLYGTDVQGAEGFLGESNSALGAENQSHPVQQGFKTFADVLTAIKQGGAAAANPPGCWIAAEIYGGWDDPRTIAVRKWLHTEFVKTAFGRIVMSAYLRFGERIAEQIKLHPLLKRIFKPVFDEALRRAEAFSG
jgi:hypothetical protein